MLAGDLGVRIIAQAKRISLVADYGMLTATQLVTTVFVARSATPPQFGLFSLAMVVLAVTTAAFAATVGVWITTADPIRITTNRAQALGGSIAAATPLLVCAVIGAVWIGLIAGSAILGFGTILAVCGRLVLESKRTLGQTLQDASGSVAAAGIGFTIISIATLTWEVSGRPGTWAAPVLIQGIVWFVIAAVILLVQRAVPSHKTYNGLIRLTNGTWRGHAPLFLASLAAQLATPLAITLGSSYASLGAVRGAQSLLSIPAQLPLALTPRLAAGVAAKRRQHAELHARDFQTWLAVIGFTTIPAAVLIAMIPNWLGEALFGQSWDGIQPLILILALSTTGNLLIDALSYYFRIEGRLKPLVRLRWFGSVLLIGSSFVGAKLLGSMGAALASSATAVLIFAATLHLLRRELSNQHRR